MTVEEVIAHYGTQVRAARALSVSQPAIANWVARGRVPSLMQLRVEYATDGQLLADDSILEPITVVISGSQERAG
jgi:DNA-binding transcriptional regulator YdaS (Cro superfamily)